MLGLACLVLIASNSTQRPPTHGLYDVWYDSSRDLIAWGAFTTHPGETGPNYWEFTFGTMVDAKVARVPVKVAPYIIVDDNHFVTHHDYSALMEATTGNAVFLARMPAQSACNGYLYLEGVYLERSDNPRQKSIARRKATAPNEFGEVVVSNVFADDGTYHLDMIEGSKDGKTVAWSFQSTGGHNRLHWVREGTRHDYESRFSSMAVSSSGRLIYLSQRGAEDKIVALDANTGAIKFSRSFEKDSVRSMCADESSDGLLIVSGSEWSASVLKSDGTALKAMGKLNSAQ